MDNLTIIREFLYKYIKFIQEEEREIKLEDSCGIISSSFPPNELYPDGYKITYPFAIKPKEVSRFI
jgi:hypothetical protein